MTIKRLSNDYQTTFQLRCGNFILTTTVEPAVLLVMVVLAVYNKNPVPATGQLPVAELPSATRFTMSLTSPYQCPCR